MTKGEYCQSKGLIIYNKKLDDEEADDMFKRVVDNLVNCYKEMHSEDEDCEV